MGISSDCPIFFGYPQLSQEREKLLISNLASTFRTKAHESFLEKMKRGSIQGLPKFFEYPLLSQEREMLRISNLASTFRVSIRTKGHWKFQRKGSVCVSRDCSIFRVPPIISGTGKAMNFKFCTHMYRLNRNKSPLKILRKLALGVVWDSRKFSGHPMPPIHTAHRAVIFAIAQFSCWYGHSGSNFEAPWKRALSYPQMGWTWAGDHIGVSDLTRRGRQTTRHCRKTRLMCIIPV